MLRYGRFNTKLSDLNGRPSRTIWSLQKVTLRDVGPPQRVIEGFAPELFGRPLDEDDVVATEVITRDDGMLYYLW
jgi:hypothetical protein